MEIRVLNNREAKEEIERNPQKWHVVSIEDYKKPKLNDVTSKPIIEMLIEHYDLIFSLAEKSNDFIICKFDDFFRCFDDSYNPPTKEDIQNVFDFINQEKPSHLIVTCSVAISRSPALAYIINCMQSKPSKATSVLKRAIHFPNSQIIRLGAEILGDQGIVDEIKKWHRSEGLD